MHKHLNIIVGGILILIGIILFFQSSKFMINLSLFLGLVFLVGSIFWIFFNQKEEYHSISTKQILSLSLGGLILLLLPVITFYIITWIFIISFLIFSIINGYKIINSNYEKNWMYIIKVIAAILFLIFSVIMIINPSIGEEALSNIIAFGIIILGTSFFFVDSKNEIQ